MANPREPPLHAYLDTCVVSAVVKSELSMLEQSALASICRAHEKGEVVLSCSPVVEEEISKIPLSYRTAHAEILRVFSSVPKVAIGGLTQLRPGGVTANPRRWLWNRLLTVLPDENDVWHLFVAARNRIRHFVTVDQRTILSRRDAVLKASGVDPMLPSEFWALIQSRQPNPPLQGTRDEAARP